jgi:hypothetical protein
MRPPATEPEGARSWLSATLRTLGSEQSLLLLGVVVLLVAHRQVGALAPPSFWPVDRGYWWFATAVVAFLLLPALAVLAFLHGRYDEYGLRLGKTKEWLPLVVILYLIVLPFLRHAAGQPQFETLYPLFAPARQGGLQLINFELVYGLYFFSWEFLFRGFLLFGLARQMGALAIPLQTVPFVLAHLGKPYPEIYGSVLAGLALGMLALRTRSMLPCFLLHWACALTLDLLVVYG